MAETQPIWMQALCYNYNELRNQFDVCGEGVVDKFGGSLLVESTGAGDHSVTVAAGSGWVEADGVNVDGMYRVTNDAPVTIQLAAGGGGNGRVDTIIATVHDSQSSGVDDDWVLTVVTGTPNAAAVSPLTDAGIAASAGAVPDMSLVLGYVLVPVADTLTTTIAANNIVDGRNNYYTCGSDPWVMLEAAAATSTANNVYTQLALATVVNRDRDYFTVSGSTITVLQTGLYDVSAMAGYTAAAAGGTLRGMLVVANNTNLPNAAPDGTAIIGPQSASTGAFIASSARQSVRLTANDTLKLALFQNTGGAVNSHDAGVPDFAAHLTVRKVG